MREDDVEITICIGLFGVCVISIWGDESELVYDNICSWGDANWHDSLPEHDKPIDGVYKITCNAWENDTKTDVVFEITAVEHYTVVTTRPKANQQNQLTIAGVL